MRTPITDEEIEASRSPAGGLTRVTFARWGISWPPPKGWRKTIVTHGIPYDPALNEDFELPPEQALGVTQESLARLMDASEPSLIDGEPFGVEGQLDIDAAKLLRTVVVAVINAGHASDLYEFPEVLAFFGPRNPPHPLTTTEGQRQ